MFIGHLPGAYIAFRTLSPRLKGAALATGLLGSIAPDIDLIWFYFVDHRAFHHHEYITHRPAIWAAISIVGLLLCLRFRSGSIVAAFGFGGLIHMLLDTIAGAINWLWPLGHLSGPIVVVQATHDHWIMSFISHWTFKVEIVVCLIALCVFLYARRKANLQK